MDRTLLLAGLASLLLFGLLDNARGPLFPDILAALRLGDAAGSLMFSATSAGAIGGMLALPGIVRRVGALVVQRGGLLVAGLSLLGYARVRGGPGLIAASFAFGVALAALALSANLLVEQAAGEARRRAGQGLLHATYGLASLMAPLAVTGAHAVGLDWRGTFAAAALVPLAALVAGLGLRRPVVARARAPGLPGRGELVLGLMVACVCVAEITISTRLVLLLERDGYPSDRAGLALAAFFACLLAGRVGLAASPARWEARRLLALSAGLSALLFGLGLAVEPLLLVGVGLTAAPFFPVTMELLARRFPDRIEAAFASAHLLVSLLLVGSHALIGALSDAMDLRRACAVGAAALIGALGLLAIDARRDAGVAVEGCPLGAPASQG